MFPFARYVHLFPPSLKLVLTVDFHVRHNYTQHLFVNIDSRYLVRHCLTPWQERRACYKLH